MPNAFDLYGVVPPDADELFIDYLDSALRMPHNGACHHINNEYIRQKKSSNDLPRFAPPPLLW
jgi:hypothetical protein